MNEDERRNLSLKMIHIPDNEEVFITDIVPLSSDINIPGLASYECYSTYINMLYLHAWSPDGRYLAFPVISTGPSSDLFVYDTEMKSLRRLTNDDAEIVSIVWSADSKIIYYVNGLEMNDLVTFNRFTVNATNPDNDSNRGIRTLLTSSNYARVIWSDQNYDVIVFQKSNVSCLAGGVQTGTEIDYIYYEQSTKQVIYSGNVYDVIRIDPIDRLILVGDYGDRKYQPAENITFSLITFEGQLHATIDGEFLLTSAYIIFLGDPKNTFLFRANCEEATRSISLSGEVQRVGSSEFTGYTAVDVSPDRKKFLLYDFHTLEVYWQNGDLLASLNLDIPETDYCISELPIVWRPDGQGVYILINENIIYLPFTASQSGFTFTLPNPKWDIRMDRNFHWVNY